jgi:hypothetical protein
MFEKDRGFFYDIYTKEKNRKAYLMGSSFITTSMAAYHTNSGHHLDYLLMEKRRRRIILR